jgi:hypothetical protein
MNVEAAEIQFRNARDREGYVRQQIKQEVIDLITKIRVAESRSHVLEQSVNVARRSYDISVERFRNGTITRNDLAQAQQRLTGARIATLTALIDHELGMADLRRKTLWDFEKGSKVEPVLPPQEQSQEELGVFPGRPGSVPPTACCVPHTACCLSHPPLLLLHHRHSGSVRPHYPREQGQVFIGQEPPEQPAP